MHNSKPILLVEDDHVDAMTVKRALKELHITNPVDTVTNGEEALSFLRDPQNGTPGIILLDRNMPKMNGIEFLTIAKQDDTLKRIPMEIDDAFAAGHPHLKPGPHLKLSVSDTGCGMLPDVQHRIFDPFFTTKREGEGTGMGLSVVHGIVTNHKGAIIAYSEPEKGSTFNLFLPTIKGTEKTGESFQKPVPGGKERILFVDDESSISAPDSAPESMKKKPLKWAFAPLSPNPY